jgi:acetyl esterase/lipase
MWVSGVIRRERTSTIPAPEGERRMRVQVELDRTYARVGDRVLCCDVFLPEPGPVPAPAAILLHGGGWRGGSRTSMHSRARALAEHGIAAIAAEYRLTDEARWPAHIQDVKACLRWLRSSATSLGIDPDRIALVGFSAGAHLALLAAGTPGNPTFGSEDFEGETVNAVAAFFPPIRMQPGIERSNGELPASAGASLGEGVDAEEARAASPIEYVRPGFPPTLLLHGTADEVVSSRSSQQFFEALTRAGVLCDLRLYHGMRHEFVKLDEMAEVAMADVALFIRRTVVDPARFDVSQEQLFSMPSH